MTSRRVLCVFGIAALATGLAASTASAGARGPNARAKASYESGIVKAQLQKEFAAGRGPGGGGTAWSTAQSEASRSHIQQKYTSLVRTNAQREMVLHVATLMSFPQGANHATAVKAMTDTLARRNAQAGRTRAAALTKQDRYLLRTLASDSQLTQTMRDVIAAAAK